jgi:hypothetical protein
MIGPSRDEMQQIANNEATTATLSRQPQEKTQIFA